ncbi:hypothetical protein [Bacillus massiliglaciei]|uniref:hypothetical protein n=1 Tax=Bacillus massiliglaciei TaxID=1816693 RepID=UPI000A48445F|nr:hypothetical protein [Bacillus massiliglaciei]
MGKKKQPKFHIGDTVVITMYGTVGNITDMKFLDGSYVYEVNYSEGLYLENTLQHIYEYKGELLYDNEQINIEYKYILGDLVKVEGYEGDYFIIIGYRTEIWRYKENAWEDVIYELSRLSDGEWLEAHEEEMTLVADAKRAEALIKKLGLFHPPQEKSTELAIIPQKNDPREGERETTMTKNEQKQIIDGLLDLYNDYCRLYKHFGDEEYRHIMNIALAKIKKAAAELYPVTKKQQAK